MRWLVTCLLAWSGLNWSEVIDYFATWIDMPKSWIWLCTYWKYLTYLVTYLSFTSYIYIDSYLHYLIPWDLFWRLSLAFFLSSPFFPSSFFLLAAIKRKWGNSFVSSVQDKLETYSGQNCGHLLPALNQSYISQVLWKLKKILYLFVSGQIGMQFLTLQFWGCFFFQVWWPKQDTKLES